jgi:hypothetical protein
MLPYLEEEQLYRQFHHDEPWDSEHNKKLIPLMPQVFKDPAATPEKIAGGLTPYQLLRGEKTAFPKDNAGLTLGVISDGLSKRFFGDFRGRFCQIRERRWLRLGGWKHLPPTTPGCSGLTTPGWLSRSTCGSRIAESKST